MCTSSRQPEWGTMVGFAGGQARTLIGGSSGNRVGKFIADCGVPISVLLSSASMHDSRAGALQEAKLSCSFAILTR